MTTPVFMLGVTGGSASGKTRLADALAELFEPLGGYVLSEDDYYIDASEFEDFDADTFNFDEPAAKDHRLLAQHLRTLKSGASVEAPLYDFTTHTRRAVSARRVPARILIVEGLHIFCTPELAEIFDLKVYVSAGEPIRLARRVARDVAERARTESSVREQFALNVQPMHALHVEPQKTCVDLLLENKGDPDFKAMARRVAGLCPRDIGVEINLKTGV